MLTFREHMARIVHHFRVMVAALRLRSLLLKVAEHRRYLAGRPTDPAGVARACRSLLWCRRRVADLPDTVADVRDPSLATIDIIVADAERRLREITAR